MMLSLLCNISYFDSPDLYRNLIPFLCLGSASFALGVGVVVHSHVCQFHSSLPISALVLVVCLLAMALSNECLPYIVTIFCVNASSVSNRYVSVEALLGDLG